MYSTTNEPNTAYSVTPPPAQGQGDSRYSMVPRAMLGDLKPTPFRQWVQLERWAKKADYVTVTTTELGNLWGISRRQALTAIGTMESAGWLVVDSRTGEERTHRLWIPWYAISDLDVRADFIVRMERFAQKRRDGLLRIKSSSPARSSRELMMAQPGTKSPYVHVPVAVGKRSATDADFLVWVAMRSFLGPQDI